MAKHITELTGATDYGPRFSFSSINCFDRKKTQQIY